MIQKLRNFLFVNQSVRQTITKNAFWLFSGQIIGRLLRVGVVIYAARVLGAESYGAFAYALGLAAFLTIFSDIGINALITREGSRDPESRKQYLATAFFIKLFLLVVIAGLVVLFAGRLTNIQEAVVLMPIVVFVFAFDTLRELGASMARALERMEIEAFVTIFTNLAVVVLGVLVLSFHPSSYSLAIAYALGSGAGFLSVAFALRSYFKDLVQNFSRGLVKRIIFSAWPFGMLSVMGAVMINTDILMLGWLRGAEAVGLYSAAQKPVLLLYIIPTLLTSAFFPVLSRLAQKSSDEFKSLFEKGIGFVLLMALPLTIGGVLLGPQIITLLYGMEYFASFPSFQILALTLIFIFPSILIGNAIFAYNKQRELIGYVLAGIFGNIIFNVLFIPIWGIEGVAISTLVNQIIINTYIWFKMKRIMKFSVFLRIWRPLVASVVMGGVVFGLSALGIHVLINIAVSAALYFGFLLLLREPLFREFRLR